MRLAVYGTLRRGFEDTGKIEGFSLVFPGHKHFPALIKNEKGKGAVVEVTEATKEELNMYDMYESVKDGLYIRTTVYDIFYIKKIIYLEIKKRDMQIIYYLQ